MIERDTNTGGWLLVHRSAANDTRLSLTARGLLLVLLAHPGKDLDDIDLPSQFAAAWTELTKLGYITKTKTGWCVTSLSDGGPSIAPLITVTPPAPSKKAGRKPKLDTTDPLIAARVALRDAIMHAYGGTKEQNYKDGLLGYKIPTYGKEILWAGKLAERGHTVEHIADCYAHVKAQKWRSPHVSLAIIYEQIDAWLTGTAPVNTQPAYTPKSFLFDDDDDELFPE